MKRKLRILVSGMVAGDPWQGGATWAVLQYVLGLRQLGHEVLLVEPIARDQVKPAGATLGASENVACFTSLLEDFDLNGDAALVLAGTQQTVGLSYDQLRKRARSSDLLINISGMLADPELTGSIPIRVYLDLDPGFNQLWHSVSGLNMRFEGHTDFVTVGLNLGEPGCTVPTCGRTWLKTLQPIVLERWPVAGSLKSDALTTVGNWRGYGSIELNGQRYGQKAHSLRQLLRLPTLTEERFLLALSIHPAEHKDLAALRENGWGVLDPAEVARTPKAYQEFIQGSKGEFGVAKSGYVVSNCAWFSDRSVCYLASGRPVIAQETGFSAHLPTGAGLFGFQDEEGALKAIDSVRSSYEKHRCKAREIAEEYFDSQKVLSRLLESINLS
jgi:hypothetical protein